jgi:hypothetical protein
VSLSNLCGRNFNFVENFYTHTQHYQQNYKIIAWCTQEMYTSTTTVMCDYLDSSYNYLDYFDYSSRLVK